MDPQRLFPSIYRVSILKKYHTFFVDCQLLRIVSVNVFTREAEELEDSLDVEPPCTKKTRFLKVNCNSPDGGKMKQWREGFFPGGEMGKREGLPHQFQEKPGRIEVILFKRESHESVSFKLHNPLQRNYICCFVILGMRRLHTSSYFVVTTIRLWHESIRPSEGMERRRTSSRPKPGGRARPSSWASSCPLPKDGHPDSWCIQAVSEWVRRKMEPFVSLSASLLLAEIEISLSTKS